MLLSIVKVMPEPVNANRANSALTKTRVNVSHVAERLSAATDWQDRARVLCDRDRLIPRASNAGYESMINA